MRRQSGRSWYVDETYLKVQGRWRYLYRVCTQTTSAMARGGTLPQRRFKLVITYEAQLGAQLN
jgi:hypothetical protein